MIDLELETEAARCPAYGEAAMVTGVQTEERRGLRAPASASRT
jgi:hypothetical protein